MEPIIVHSYMYNNQCGIKGSYSYRTRIGTLIGYGSGTRTVAHKVIVSELEWEL